MKGPTIGGKQDVDTPERMSPAAGATASYPFPRYTKFDPLVPVWNATPTEGGAIHRFFDTSPFSPSGRYLGLTRLPFEDRLPQPGDVARVVVVDLHTGEERTVAETRGWDTQVGAHVQWGADDTQLYFNDVDMQTWRPYGVRVDPLSGHRLDLEGTVYMVSPDGTQALSPALTKMGLTQKGYGVILPSGHAAANCGAPGDDGIFVTDTSTGTCRMLVSIAQIIETAEPPFDPGQLADMDFYVFHVKWNPQADRIMAVLRWGPRERARGRLRHTLVSMGVDGTDVRVAVPNSIWDRGGHHPNWCPDGETISINLKLDGEHLQFVRVRYDGSGIAPLTEAVPGSGHPTMHPDGRHVLTDVYLHEPLAYGDGTTPIRWIDTEIGSEQVLIRIDNNPPFPGPVRELRIDPHPAWDRSFRRIAFNGCEGGRRRVYIADLSQLLSPWAGSPIV